MAPESDSSAGPVSAPPASATVPRPVFKVSKPTTISLTGKPSLAKPPLKLASPLRAPTSPILNPIAGKLSEPDFKSPMPDLKLDGAAVPIWQPVVAGLAAVASLTVAVLLFLQR